MWGSEQRARRRRAQEMERRLQELDRIDALYGLGTPPNQVPQPRRRRSILPLILIAGCCWWAFSNGYVESLLTGLRSYLGMDAVATPWEAPDEEPTRAAGPIDSPLVQLPLVEVLEPQPQQPGSKETARPKYSPNAPKIVEAGGSFAFQKAQQLDPTVPVTFDPCKPINMIVNSSAAPEGYMGWIEPAIERTRAATGMDIVMLGVSDDNRWERREMNDPVLITWATEAESDRLAGDTAGVGVFMAWGPSSGPSRAMTGSIVLDLEVFTDPLVPHDVKRAIVQHELSHVLGLDHVDNPSELMHPTATVTEFGPGDLEGLAHIGNVPCG